MMPFFVDATLQVMAADEPALTVLSGTPLAGYPLGALNKLKLKSPVIRFSEPFRNANRSVCFEWLSEQAECATGCRLVAHRKMAISSLMIVEAFTNV